MKRRRRKLKACRSHIPCARAIPGSDSYKAGLLCPADVDQRQLRAGIKVELEHGPSKARACRIALDHLSEDRKYYTKLRKARL